MIVGEPCLLHLLWGTGQRPEMADDGCSTLNISEANASHPPLHRCYTPCTPHPLSSPSAMDLPVSTWRAAIPALSFNITLLSLFDFKSAQDDSLPHSTIVLALLAHPILSLHPLPWTCLSLFPPLSFNITLLSLFDFKSAQEDSSLHLTIFLNIASFGFFTKPYSILPSLSATQHPICGLSILLLSRILNLV